MVVRIYKAGNLYTVPERVQTDRLIGYLKREFANRNEDCSIIIEPRIPENFNGVIIDRKPDALILKDNMLILIEMKGFNGKIIADCNMGGIWRTKRGTPLHQKNRNPFLQAQSYRKLLITHLYENFSKKMFLPGNSRNKDFIRGLIAQHVRSWVITEEASQPVLTGIATKRQLWFKLLPLNKLAQSLVFFRNEPFLPPEEQKRFIKSLKAELVHSDKWFRGSITESPISDLLIPKITDWIESGNHDDISRALTSIQELDLKNHVNHVVECWHNNLYPDLRKQALLILIDWQYEKVGSILNEALNDDSPDIAWFALNYLSKYGYAETLPTLTDILRKGPQKAQVIAVKAIANSGVNSSCAILFDFAKELLANKPFEPFQNWIEQIKNNSALRTKGVKDEEFAKLQQKKANLSELSITVIRALGTLGCKESIPWIKRIIDKPSELGFETDDYQGLQFIPGYFGIFESACESLGMLGIGNKPLVELFISKLEKAQEDFQQCIIQTLGNIGNLNAESALIPFVADRKNFLFYDSVLALSRLRSQKAFKLIAKAYLHNPLDRNGRLAEQALAKIAPPRFEGLLLEQIVDMNNSDEQKALFLRALLPVASLRSAPVLFSLLENEELSYYSTWILGNLSNNSEVFKRAMELTQSKIPTEQAHGISILDDYFMENLEKLEKFKPKDAPVEVRRIISSIYYAADARTKLLEYANDADQFVRDNVFFKIASDEMFWGCCFVVGHWGAHSRCEIAIDKEVLAIKLPDEVLLLSKQFITYGQITRNEADTYGMYLEITKSPNLIQKMLLVPLDRVLGNPEKMSQQILSHLNVQRRNRPTGFQKSVIDNLWAKIPTGVLQKNN